MAQISPPHWTDLKAKYVQSGRTGVLGIVLHDTAGNGTHDDTLYLANPGDSRRVSCDFTVERDGAIWKLNPDIRSMHSAHAGRSTKWRQYVNASVNLVTVGIEIVQHQKLKLSPVYPVAQINAVAHLCAWLTAEFKLSASDITTHRQIITDGSRSDPRKFPFDGKDGFWHKYWEFFGNEQKFLDSL
jgi:N-acetyl-anhydromuramyl-L-alanine amidase AmpD